MRRITNILLVFCFAATAGAGDSPNERYFAGLRQRGLLDLAEGEALRRLADDAADEAERLTLVAELARTFSEHAKYAEGHEQADLWMRADQLILDFLEDHPKAGRRADLEVLRGEIALSQGETLRWLADLVPEQPDFRTSALASLSAAVTRLSSVEQQLEQRLANRNRSRSSPAEPLAARELDELLTRARLALGRSELERARLGTPLQRLDWIAAAERWLEPVSHGPPTSDASWQAQVALAESALLAGKTDLVRRRISVLKPAELPDAAKDAIAVISAKLLLDERKPDRAVAFLIDYRRSRGTLSGELRMLQIKGLEAAAVEVARTVNEHAAQELRDQIPVVVRWTESEHGGYWAYRARLAQRRADRTARYGPAVIEQIQQAEAAFAGGDIDLAVSRYQRAESLVHDDVPLAVELASQRATLLLNSNRFAEAASAFLSVADREADQEKAANAHLLSAYALGRYHDAAPSTERRTAYIDRLEDHRSRFASSPTAAEAALRLARLYEQRRQYSQAIPLLREAIDDAGRRTVAEAAIARNYANLLQYLKQSKAGAATSEEALARDEQLDQWTETAVNELTSLTAALRAPSAAAPPLSEAEAELALRTSQVLLAARDGSGVADRLLDRLAETLHHASALQDTYYWDAVSRSARPLLIVSLANRGRYDEAAKLVDELESAPAGDLLSIVQGLAELSDPDDHSRRPLAFGPSDEIRLNRLSDLRARATGMLNARKDELNLTDQKQLNVLLATSNFADGRVDVAAAQFDEAVEQRPRDKSLLLQAATLLGASNDSEAVTKSRDYWRRLESLEPTGSNAWLKARLHVIETSLVLGDVAEARKLMSVTRLLHPRLGGGETKAAFEAVQRRLGAETTGSRRSESR